MGLIIRQSIKGAIVSYVGSGVGFLITMFVVTKCLTPEIFGLTVILYEVAALVSSFAQLGISSSALRFFPSFKDPKNGDNGFFFYLLLLPSVGLLIFIPIFILSRSLIISLWSQNAVLIIDYYYWIIPLIVFCTYWVVFETYSTLQMRIVIPKFIREVGVRIMLLFVYVFFSLDILNVRGLVGGVIIVYGMAMLFTFAYICLITSISLDHNHSFINKSLRKQILNYTVFLVLGSLSGSLLNQLDLFMISSRIGLSSAGIYRIAFYISVVIDIPYRSISSISSPIAAKALQDENMEVANSLYQKVALNQFVVGSCIFVFLWININNLFSIIPNGVIYAQGKWVVFFLALARIISTTLAFGAILISFSRFYYWNLFFSLFLSCIGIGVNLLLIPRLGITGAAVATLITCLLSYVVQQGVVLLKIKANPFTAGFIKQIILVFLLFLLNGILPDWSYNPIVDGFYRTLIIGTVTVGGLYWLQVSEEFSALINKYIFRRGLYKE